MTREEKLKMLLHPEQYTDEQINQMLDDTDIDVPDAEGEWLRLETKRSMTRKPLMRWAAMIVGVLMLSGITYAAYRTIYNVNSQHQSTTQNVEQVKLSQSANKHTVHTDTTLLTKPIVYENVELATILNDLVAYYHVQPIYKKEASKHIRLYFTWDQTAGIDDIIDTFNMFERIHITREDHKLIVE